MPRKSNEAAGARTAKSECPCESTEARIEGLIIERRLADAEILCEALKDTAPEAAAMLLEKIRRASLERLNAEVPTAYHRWFYDNLIWEQRSWAGVPIYKSPLDLWNYQEILAELRPTLVIEFGANAGGSAVFFADMLRILNIENARVISVDIELGSIHPLARERADIAFLRSSSTAPLVKRLLAGEREKTPGAVFAILDSDHTKDHVYGEMLMLRDILRTGDYLIVEDGNINGHPVLPGWGPGPYEAIEQYVNDFPHDYEADTKREHAFGWTAAPRGFLKRL